MSDTDRLLNARSAWSRTPVPADRFREGDGTALTYGIECDLDHQASYLTGLLAAIDRRDPNWDFALRADHELRDLLSFRDRLKCLEENSPPYAATILAYMDVTADLLHAIIESTSAPRGAC
jgi:hypothetical protein